MKRLILAASLLAAACGQSATTASTATTDAAAAPQSLMEKTLAQAGDMQPIAALTVLRQYQAAHPEATPACTSVREADSRGIIPADVADGSVYKPFAGALVFAVQCGPQLTTVRPSPHEHWLVVMAPGQADAVIVNCADARGNDACVMPIPRQAAVATTTPASAP